MGEKNQLFILIAYIYVLTFRCFIFSYQREEPRETDKFFWSF